MNKPGDVANPELARALCTGDSERVSACLPLARLLVPAREVRTGQSLLASGAGARRERLLWAFTDVEALKAWDRQRWPAAATIDGAELAAIACGPASETLGSVVVVNAAGPAATLLPADQLAGVAPLDRRPPGPDAQPLDPGLADPDVRRPWRVAAREHHGAGRRAIDHDDLGAAGRELSEAAAACGALGDRLHGAAVMAELARCRHRLGEVAPAAAILQRAAVVLGSLGELDLAIAGLLEVAEWAAADGEITAAAGLADAALAAAAGTEVASRLGALWRTVIEAEPETTVAG